VASGRDNAGHLATVFKETKRRLRRAIERSKEEKWREFRATLEQAPWGRPYRAIRVKIARSTPPDGLRMDRVPSILDDLFVTKRGEQGSDEHRPRITRMHGEELQDLCITEEDLLTAMEKCNTRKAAGAEGIPEEVVRIIAEQRPGRLLDLLNNITSSRRIPEVWKVAGVILLPKPAKDPLLSSSYRPIIILPALSKVWEYTCKMLIERCLGRDPFLKEQYGFR
jgi:hypothetical protein